jgi:hypothetical protein
MLVGLLKNMENKEIIACTTAILEEFDIFRKTTAHELTEMDLIVGFLVTKMAYAELQAKQRCESLQMRIVAEELNRKNDVGFLIAFFVAMDLLTVILAYIWSH